MALKIYHGDIVYAESESKLNVHQDSYIGVCDGVVEGIYAEIPEKYHCGMQTHLVESKWKAFYEPEGNASIDFTNAFYQATKAGGSVFGKVGFFEKGYAFNALVIDGTEDVMAPLTPVERLERFCYAGDDRNIISRYLGGKAI